MEKLCLTQFFKNLTPMYIGSMSSVGQASQDGQQATTMVQKEEIKLVFIQEGLTLFEGVRLNPILGQQIF